MSPQTYSPCAICGSLNVYTRFVLKLQLNNPCILHNTVNHVSERHSIGMDYGFNYYSLIQDSLLHSNISQTLILGLIHYVLHLKKLQPINYPGCS